MGRGIIEAGLFRTERVELETRTSDPASPADGERWLRTDLDGETDKLAELRWHDGSSTRSINVVAPGSTDTDVEEVLRIQTPNGTGVVPAVSPPGDAGFPSQRLRHAGTDYGLGAVDIPFDADLYHAILPEYLAANYADGNGISDWKSDDGSATLTPTTNGSEPTYDAGVVTTDGAAAVTGQNGSSSEGNNLQASGLADFDAGNSGFCFGVVVRNRGETSNSFGGVLVDDVNDNQEGASWTLRWDQGNYNLQTSASRRTSVAAPDDGNPHTVIVSNIDAGLEMYLDGGSADDSSAFDPSFITSSLGVGQFQAAGDYYNFAGDIGGSVVYNSGKTESEVGEIHDYLINL